MTDMMPLWKVACILILVVLVLFILRTLFSSKKKTSSSSTLSTPKNSSTIENREIEEDEPEGTKVASVHLPIAKGASTPSLEIQEARLNLSEEIALNALDLGIDDPTGPIALILVTAVGQTDAGRKRKHNEDSYLVLEDHSVFVIADGMGGYAAGEIASQLAVDVLGEAFKTNTFVGDPNTQHPRRGDELVRAIQMANTAILTQARANEAQTGMGTTLVACRFSPNKQRVYIAHVGDSRCYRIRNKQLKQMTIDHTLATAGIVGPAAAKLSRAVGISEYVEVDLTVDAPQIGDYYILCSDGLSKMVPDETVLNLVLSDSNLESAVQTLIRAANERGGRDNVTVILIRVDPPKFK